MAMVLPMGAANFVFCMFGGFGGLHPIYLGDVHGCR